MARYGVIADLHGNLQALEAALAFLDRAGVDRVVCLGDLVGYNADGDACVGVLRARGIDCIAGNHDLIAIGRLGFDKCALRAAYALRRTRVALAPATRVFLAALPPSRRYEDRILLVHGGLDDPTEYLRTPAAVAAAGARLAARDPAIRVCFFGHTHTAGVYTLGPAGLAIDVPSGPIALAREHLTLVNPGSVDAARRSDKHAELAIFDSNSWELALHRVAYDDLVSEHRARTGGYRMRPAEEAVAEAWQRGRRLVSAAGRRASDLLSHARRT